MLIALTQAASQMCFSAGVLAGWRDTLIVPAMQAAHRLGAACPYLVVCQRPVNVSDVWHCFAASTGGLVAVALRLDARGCAIAACAGWVVGHSAHPLAMALCESGTHAVGVRASLWRGLPPVTAQILKQIVADGWRVGVISSVLLLPPGLQLLASFTQWLAAALTLCTIIAHGFDRMAAQPPPPEPLGPGLPAAWARRADGVVRRLCGSLASASLPPTLLSLPHARWAGSTHAASKQRAAVTQCEGRAAGGAAAAGSGRKDAAASDVAAAATALGAARQQRPPPPSERGPAVAASLSAAVPGRLAARLAAPAPARSCLYTSATRRAAVSVKVRVDDAACATDAEREALYSRLRVAIAGALDKAARGSTDGSGDGAAPASVGGAAAVAAPPPPVLQSFAAFRGCIHAVGEVAHAQPQPPPEAQVAAALVPLLPSGVTLMSVTIASFAQQTAAAEGMWCEPAVLDADGEYAKACLVLPPALLAQLAAQGGGLRVVLAAGVRGVPLSDLTLRPHEAGWPADGRVRVTVPCDAGALVVATLLHAAPAPEAGARAAAAEHGADRYITALPLLVLPHAERCEAALLWQDMCDHAAADLPASGAAAAPAAAAFSSNWMPFAMDLGLALEHGSCGTAEQLRTLATGLHALLRERGMSACARALARAGVEDPSPSDDDSDAAAAATRTDACDASGSAGGATASAPRPEPTAAAAAAASAGASRRNVRGALPPAVAAARAVFVGFGAAAGAAHGGEGAYQAWRARQLVTWDMCLFWGDVMRNLTLAAWTLWFSLVVDPLHGATALAIVLLTAALQLGPLAALGARRRARRLGDWAVAAGTAATGLLTCALPVLVGQMGMVRHVALTMQRPHMMAIILLVFQPAVHRLGVWEQALASVGLAATVTTYNAALHPAAWSPRWWGPWWALSVAVAAAMELGLRRQWLLRSPREGGEAGCAKRL